MFINQNKSKIDVVFFFYFIIPATGGHCDYSRQEPKSYLRHWRSIPQPVLSGETHLTQLKEIGANSERAINSSLLFLRPPAL
jgi:hypothetical protein